MKKRMPYEEYKSIDYFSYTTAYEIAMKFIPSDGLSIEQTNLQRFIYYKLLLITIQNIMEIQ